MAEILGVISSVIAVVGLAGQVAKKTQTLRRIWSEVKDAPENFLIITAQLDLLQSILIGMKDSFVESPETYNNIKIAKQSIEYCDEALSDLDTLMDDIIQQIDDGTMIKKSKFRFKAMLKKDQIQLFKDRLHSALQLLSLSQQLYISSLVMLQPTMIMTKLDHLRQEMLSEKEPKPSSVSTVQNQGVIRNTASSDGWINLGKLPWRAPGYFRGISYEVQNKEINGEDCNIYQARVQLPFWLHNKTWDIHARQAYSGWKLSLRPRTIRPFSSNIMKILKTGNRTDLCKVLAQSGRSIHDVDFKGKTLIHHAVEFRRYDIIIELMQLGARLDERDEQGWTAFDRACKIARYSRLAPSFFRQLASNGALQDLAELYFPFSYHTRHSIKDSTLDISSLEVARFQIPGLTGILAKLPYHNYSEVSWTRIPWTHINPTTFLEIIEHGKMTSLAAFQQGTVTNYYSSIRSLVGAYISSAIFSQLIPSSQNSSEFNDWRQICRHAFRRVSVDVKSKPHFENLSCSPLHFALFTWSFGGFVGGGKCMHRLVKVAVRNWLEDLVACDVDLEAYGRNELLVFMSKKGFSYDKYSLLQHQDIDSDERRGPRLASMAYGPRPEDWKFVWDFFMPEYAKEFWAQVDPVPTAPRMPGSWVTDA